MDQTLRLLAHDSEASDEERVVAVALLLPALLQRKKTADVEQPATGDDSDIEQGLRLRTVAETIDWRFIARLLRSTSHPQLQIVAMRLMAACCVLPDLAAKADIYKRIPLLDPLLQASRATSEDDAVTIIGIYTQVAAASPAATAHLLEAGSISSVLDATADTTTAPQVRSLALKEFLPVFFNSCPKKERVGITGRAIETVARILDNDHTVLKFEALSCCVSILSVCGPLAVARTKSANLSWPGSLRSGLLQLLRSKLGSNEREKCILLAALVVNSIGSHWLLPTLTRGKEKSNEDSHRLTALLIHICAAELRARLDDFSQSKPEIPRQEVLIASLSVIETYLRGLMQFADENDDSAPLPLPAETLISLRDAVSECLVAVLASLVDRYECHLPELLDGPLVAACTRCVLVWIADESAFPAKEVRSALPAIAAVCERQSSPRSMAEVLSGCFCCLLDHDQDTRAALKESRMLEVLIRWCTIFENRDTDGPETCIHAVLTYVMHDESIRDEAILLPLAELFASRSRPTLSHISELRLAAIALMYFKRSGDFDDGTTLRLDCVRAAVDQLERLSRTRSSWDDELEDMWFLVLDALGWCLGRERRGIVDANVLMNVKGFDEDKEMVAFRSMLRSLSVSNNSTRPL